jgi:predicted metal-dependent hydrolase
VKKEYKTSEGLVVEIYKRKNNRNIRLSITSSNNVRVTIPSWVPYKVGLDFANKKSEWIKKHYKKQQVYIDNQLIGKAHRIKFKFDATNSQPQARINNQNILVTLSPNESASSRVVQDQIARAVTRALRIQADKLLPQRLSYLADKNNIVYKSVKIKNLKSRWGSCDQDKNIVLNLYLMNLSWDLIDYVLLHELTHTIVMQHGPKFWAFLETLMPDAKARRKQIRNNSLGID